MVVVFFNHTVRTQNVVLEDSEPADNIIEVVGQQWSWTFNYVDDLDETPTTTARRRVPLRRVRPRGRHRRRTSPTLWLPVDETTRFNLTAPT